MFPRLDRVQFRCTDIVPPPPFICEACAFGGDDEGGYGDEDDAERLEGRLKATIVGPAAVEDVSKRKSYAQPAEEAFGASADDCALVLVLLFSRGFLQVIEYMRIRMRRDEIPSWWICGREDWRETRRVIIIFHW